nr:hypothetical protein CJLB15_00061 [Campylobacter phage CJLB-15]
MFLSVYYFQFYLNCYNIKIPLKLNLFLLLYNRFSKYPSYEYFIIYI